MKSLKARIQSNEQQSFCDIPIFWRVCIKFWATDKIWTSKCCFLCTVIIFCTVLSTYATAVYIPPALTFDCPEHFCQQWDDSTTPACELHQPPSLGGPWNRERTAGALLQSYPFWTPSPTIHTAIRISKC